MRDLAAERERLADANLSGSEFRRAHLHRYWFQSCDFSGMVFGRTEWSGYDFPNCRFDGMIWTDTVMRSCKGDGGWSTVNQ